MKSGKRMPNRPFSSLEGCCVLFSIVSSVQFSFLNDVFQRVSEGEYTSVGSDSIPWFRFGLCGEIVDGEFYVDAFFEARFGLGFHEPVLAAGGRCIFVGGWYGLFAGFGGVLETC